MSSSSGNERHRLECNIFVKCQATQTRSASALLMGGALHRRNLCHSYNSYHNFERNTTDATKGRAGDFASIPQETVSAQNNLDTIYLFIYFTTDTMFLPQLNENKLFPCGKKLLSKTSCILQQIEGLRASCVSIFTMTEGLYLYLDNTHPLSSLAF